MKNISQIVIYFLFFLPKLLLSQNLVPNPSFEEHSNFRFEFRITNTCKKWWSLGPADYYNKDSPYKDMATPGNRFGYQIPHSGKAYAGICLHDKGSMLSIEYIETRLTQILEKNKKYCIKLYVSPAWSSPFEKNVKSFGILFTPTALKINSEKVKWFYKPQITFDNPNGFEDTLQWTYLSKIYTANGDEHYITMGHFDRQEKSHGIYFIDDVSVELLKNESECTCEGKAVGLPDTHDLKSSAFLYIIYFEIDKVALVKESQVELKKVIKLLKKNPTLKIEISGHADNTGDEEHNILLSKARTKSVENYLIVNGISNERLQCTGYGSLKPATNNKTENEKAKNRRVELKLFE